MHCGSMLRIEACLLKTVLKYWPLHSRLRNQSIRDHSAWIPVWFLAERLFEGTMAAASSEPQGISEHLSWQLHLFTCSWQFCASYAFLLHAKEKAWHEMCSGNREDHVASYDLVILNTGHIGWQKLQASACLGSCRLWGLLVAKMSSFSQMLSS